MNDDVAESDICPSGNGHLDELYEEDGRKGFKCKRCPRIQWWDENEEEK